MRPRPRSSLPPLSPAAQQIDRTARHGAGVRSRLRNPRSPVHSSAQALDHIKEYP
jgi:hypothetical protein